LFSSWEEAVPEGDVSLFHLIREKTIQPSMGKKIKTELMERAADERP